MNNVITNGKASISDWTNSNYEKKVYFKRKKHYFIQKDEEKISCI